MQLYAKDANTGKYAEVALQADPSTGALRVLAVGTGAIRGPTDSGQNVSGTPVRVAMVARTANTYVSGGQVTEVTTTTAGVQVQRPFSIPELDWSSTGTSSAASTPVVAKAAAGAALKNYVTGIQLSNMGLATTINILRGTTVIWSIDLPTGGILAVSLASPLASAVNEAINFSQSAASTIRVSMQGYVGQ